MEDTHIPSKSEFQRPTGELTIFPEQLTMVAPSSSLAVAVYCGASLGKQKAFQLAAVSLGHALAEAKRPLIYGGGNRGLMGVVSGGATDGGGQVIGIIPYAILAAGGEEEKGDGIAKSEYVAEALDTKRRERIETIVVDSMHERKIEMARRVGAFVGLPGGFGTFEEILEVITWNQLNIHNKPVVLLNVLSFFNPLRDLIRSGIRDGFIKPQSERLCVFVDGPADQGEHESFNWGQAAVDAIAAWQHDQVQTLPFHWTKDSDSSVIPDSEVDLKKVKGMNGLRGLKATNAWLKRVWHARSFSTRL